MPEIAPQADADMRAIAVAGAVHAAIQNSTADPAHIYLAGRGDDAALVFYIVARVPDLWAAGFALGGSPKPAVAGGRVFGVNFTNTPVIWISDAPGDAELASRLKSAGLNIEWKNAKEVTIAKFFEDLAKRVRTEFPTIADCETNTAKFAQCYWMEPTKFDGSERNDVLPNTRVLDGSGASLDLGGFGYKLTDHRPRRADFLPAQRLLRPAQDRRPTAWWNSTASLSPMRADFDARLNKMYAEKLMVALVQRGKGTPSSRYAQSCCRAPTP